ncbi:MAG: glycosyltransferase [Alphaproteobacteria bacterium]|nr:glycosyltransferase [Alphaproteobacteria bacterium]MBV9370138.1 glycosyltransferase [Alphaproteobacteria bacterium]MBV9901478.1 glycosyltransferase [Alphaproteobacteria bacterium]
MDRRDERPVAAIFRSALFNPSETFVQAHAAGLVRYRPLVVGLEDKGNAWPALRDARLVASRGERLRLRLLGDADGLAARVRAHRPSLVHAHFATDGLLALPLAERLGVPLVTTLHGFDVSRSSAALLRSGRLSWMRHAALGGRLRARGRLFLAVSDAIRAKALARGFPPERTMTLHNGVDLARFAAPPAPEPGLVLHVGRLVEKKGTALLIDALAAVPGARLVVLGDGPLRTRLERRAERLGGRATFLGAVPPDEVGAWMRRAWLLAVPSVTAADGDSEGLPTVAVEAAAAGLPAVVSAHSGLPEAVVDGETGLVVPEGDAAALAAALAGLLGSADLQARMGGAARRLAAERFDLRRQIARLEAIYDGLAG